MRNLFRRNEVMCIFTYVCDIIYIYIHVCMGWIFMDGMRECMWVFAFMVCGGILTFHKISIGFTWMQSIKFGFALQSFLMMVPTCYRFSFPIFYCNIIVCLLFSLSVSVSLSLFVCSYNAQFYMLVCISADNPIFWHHELMWKIL